MRKSLSFTSACNTSFAGGAVRISIIALACLFLPAIAAADTQTVSCGTFSSTTDFNLNLACQQFNPLLGTLNSISLTIGGGFGAEQLLFTNNSASVQSMAATINSNLNLGALPGFPSVLNPFATQTILVTVSVPSGQKATVSSPAGSQVLLMELESTVLAPYTGGGVFDINFSTLTSTKLVGIDGQSTLFSDTITAAGNAEVSYDYTPGQVTATPEPGTTSLFLSGMLGLGLLVGMRRLRRSPRA